MEATEPSLCPPDARVEVVVSHLFRTSLTLRLSGVESLQVQQS